MRRGYLMSCQLKTCSKCKETKPIVEYNKNKKSSDKLHHYCKTCHRSCSRERYLSDRENNIHDKKAYYQANKEKIKEKAKKYYQTNKGRYAARWRVGNLKYKFGITQDDYERMLADQKDVCAICWEACSSGKRLAVDHCHTTGIIRGLLCMSCNTAIGKLKDDVSLLKAAIAYLEKAKEGV